MRRRRQAPRAAALLAALIACLAPLAAQDVSVRARADRRSVEESGQVVLTVEIYGTSLGEVAPPDVSGISDFDIVGGPMTSNRFQWVNGQTSSTRIYTYFLRPRKTGTQKIPSLGLLVNGHTYHTESIEVEVTQGTGAPPGQPPPQGGVRGGPGVRPPGPGRSQPETQGGAQIQVVADVDTRSAYVGQQITLRVLLDTQTEILNLGMKDTPTFPGFWVEEIKLPENLDLHRVQRGNDSFNEYTLMKRALFPTGSGTLTLPSLTYQLQVRRRSQDPIESFFFTPTETITRHTQPVVIHVQPLPADSRPKDFSGAVGNFNLTVAADRKESQVNDAVGVKVKVAGEGNLNAVNAVPFPEMSDFKQYAPKVTSSTSFAGDRLRGEKVWDYVLIPLAPGTQTVPQVSFSYFDPKAAVYRTITSPPMPIQVARGQEGGGAQAGRQVTQTDVRPLRRDIHFIKQAPDGLRDRSRPWYRAPWFLLLLLVPPASDVGVFVYTRTRDSQRANARRRRERRARSMARRRLKDARRHMQAASSRVFYAEVAQALTEYVAAKFDTSAAGLTRERVEELLSARSVSEADRRAFHECLEACDYARFAPTSSGTAEMRQAISATEAILSRIERALSA